MYSNAFFIHPTLDDHIIFALSLKMIYFTLGTFLGSFIIVRHLVCWFCPQRQHAVFWNHSCRAVICFLKWDPSHFRAPKFLISRVICFFLNLWAAKSKWQNTLQALTNCVYVHIRYSKSWVLKVAIRDYFLTSTFTDARINESTYIFKTFIFSTLPLKSYYSFLK